jgi:hypothetical protein
MAGPFDFLYEPATNKYIIDLIVALFATFLNHLADGLKGWNIIFKASHIETGTYNWTMFTIYLTLFIPHYAGDSKKLGIFALVLVFFWLLTVGCWVVKTKGQEWRSHEDISKIALSGSPLLLAILSFAVFIFFDYYFWVLNPYI